MKDEEKIDDFGIKALGSHSYCTRGQSGVGNFASGICVGISAFAERFCGSIERLAPPQLLVRSAAQHRSCERQTPTHAPKYALGKSLQTKQLEIAASQKPRPQATLTTWFVTTTFVLKPALSVLLVVK